MATVIKGRYALLETLGAGGEARVVKAVDAQHDRLVALKIRPVRDAETRAELLNEARVLLAVPPHPALPLVREDFFDGDEYVVAMDWVDGTDLETLLRDRGRPGLAASSVLEYLSDAAQALMHLHGQDPPIIHGDVKPGNLILTRGGRVMLVDFGLSSAPNAHRRRAGTPGYRAPELAADGAPSPASDIFALAATAFALLTGAPRPGGSPPGRGSTPPRPSSWRPRSASACRPTPPVGRPRPASWSSGCGLAGRRRFPPASSRSSFRTSRRRPPCGTPTRRQWRRRSCATTRSSPMPFRGTAVA